MILTIQPSIAFLYLLTCIWIGIIGFIALEVAR